MTTLPLLQICESTTRQKLEAIIGRQLQDMAVVFAFPGLGIGEIHDCLRGCSLETQLFQEAAEIFNPLGVEFIGISSGRVPTTESKVTYLQIPQPIPPFMAGSIKGEAFFSRETFVILRHAVWNVKAKTGIDEHLAVVKSLLAREIAKSMIKPTT
jgi:hypothetical protein